MQMAGSAFILTVAGLFLGAHLRVTRATGEEERPGVCPPSVGLMLEACTDICKVDSDCQDIPLKCCKTGCNGKSCKMPNEKPGECAVVTELRTEGCADHKLCVSDTNCANSLKCCKSSCGGHSCQTPEVPHTTMKPEDKETVPSGALNP